MHNKLIKKPKILVVLPCLWDHQHLTNTLISEKHEIDFYGEELFKFPLKIFNSGYNYSRFLSRLKKYFVDNKYDAIIGTHDYVSCLISSKVSEDLGLPSPPLKNMLLCQHKYYSRIIQKEVAPHAVPSFNQVGPETSNKEIQEFNLKFPLFIKPVKATFSLMAHKVESLKELQKVIRIPFYKQYILKKMLRPMNELFMQYPEFEIDIYRFILEDHIEGKQFTIEALVNRHQVQFINTVDSVMYPNSVHFIGFVSPSKILKSVQERAQDITRKVIKATGLDNSLFNIEFFYNYKNDELKIIEINPRICGQFTSIHQMLLGVNTYQVQLDLATGIKPVLELKKGKFKYAAALALRTFEDKVIRRVPSEESLNRIYTRYSDCSINIFGQLGRRLSSEPQDEGSFVYALVNIGAQSEMELYKKFDEIRKLIDFEFEFESEKKLDQHINFKLNTLDKESNV